MYEPITVKDIVAINRIFDEGRIINQGSLEFAVAHANQQGSWLKAAAILVRAVLIDHIFEEANKRTAAGIIVAALEDQGLLYNREVVAKGIASMLKKNTNSIEQIQRVIKNAIRT